jgi:hypothetical protein
MKISSVAFLAFVALERGHPVSSFLTPQTANVAPIRTGARSFGVEMAAETESSTLDISIPYGAPAELAYKGWLEKYEKPYDADRYAVFLSNYRAITVMNVTAKKTARETPDGGKPSLLTLNEYADCTAEEYNAAMKGGSKDSESSADDSSSDAEDAPTTTGNILGDAVKAVQSQSSASSALQEAADALEAEEEVCGEMCYRLLFLCFVHRRQFWSFSLSHYLFTGIHILSSRSTNLEIGDSIGFEQCGRVGGCHRLPRGN